MKSLKSERLGMIKKMNNGLSCKIIEYNSAHDITVQFENNVIRRSSFKSFTLGQIATNFKELSTDYSYCRKNRVGEKAIMKCGLEVEIIGYVNANNITVKFPTGYIIKTSYKSFKDRSIIPYKDYYKEVSSRLGEKRVMNNGVEAEIVEYFDSMNCTVKFVDSPVLIKDVVYGRFVRGQIKHPDDLNLRHRGEKRVMKNGLTAEIVDYRNVNDIDVIIEGYLIEGIRYESFCLGTLQVPYLRRGRLQFKCKNKNYYKCNCLKCNNVYIFDDVGFKQHLDLHKGV